jgi:hypothetical protein
MLKKLDEQGFNHSKEKAEVILQKFIEYVDVPFKWKTVIHLGAGKDATCVSYQSYSHLQTSLRSW